MSGVENLRAGAQAMQNLAKEPFAGISAPAFGEKMGTNLAGKLGDLSSFRNAGMVLPKPGHCRGVPGEPPIQRQWPALAIHRYRRTAGRIHPETDDLFRLESAHNSLRHSERLLNRDFGPGHVIRRVLP